MALLLKNGAVFLHIPKTGGNWVTTALEELDLVAGPIGVKHSDYLRTLHQSTLSTRFWSNQYRVLRYQVDRRELRRQRFYFCFVRHPLSWYESWWKYMSQPSRQWRHWGDIDSERHWHPNALLNGLGEDDFNAFVRNVARKRPGYVTEMFGWYTPPAVSFVGRQENLADDLIKVLRLLDVRFDADRIRALDRVGVSPKPSRPCVWDTELREEVHRLEYAGIVRYGYEPLAIGDSTLRATIK